MVEERTRELKSANKQLKEENNNRKRAQKDLAESEERYRIITENANDRIGIFTSERHVYLNRRFAEIYGYDSQEEAQKIPIQNFIHPDDIEKILEMGARRRAGEIKGGSFEHRGLRKDGSTVYVPVKERL